MLHALVMPTDDEGLQRNRRYFSRIRRLTHIYLDTANLPTYVHFQPVILFQKIADDPALFLEESNDATNRMISGILDYLQDEIYASAQANKYKLNRMDGLLARFEEVETTNRSPTRNPSQLSKWILGAKGGEFWGYKEPGAERNHRLRLRMISDGYFSPDHVKVISGAAKFHQIVKNARWSTIITSYEGPLGHSCFLDLYEKDQTRSHSYGAVLAALLGFLKDCYSSHARLPQVFNWLCEERFVDLLKFALNCALPGAHKYRFVKTQSFSEFAVVLIEQKAARTEWSKSVAWAIKKQKHDTDRKWEIECLKREIRSAPRGYVMTATCPIIVEDARHSSIAEFDGVFVRIFKNKLEVTIIEAKNTHKSGSVAARRSLSEKLTRLGVENATERIIKRQKYACVSLTK